MEFITTVPAQVLDYMFRVASFGSFHYDDLLKQMDAAGGLTHSQFQNVTRDYLIDTTSHPQVPAEFGRRTLIGIYIHDRVHDKKRYAVIQQPNGRQIRLPHPSGTNWQMGEVVQVVVTVVPIAPNMSIGHYPRPVVPDKTKANDARRHTSTMDAALEQLLGDYSA